MYKLRRETKGTFNQQNDWQTDYISKLAEIGYLVYISIELEQHEQPEEQQQQQNKNNKNKKDCEVPACLFSDALLVI